MYPVFLKLDGRPVLVVGGGSVAAGKLEGLLAAGAKVTVVAPEIRPEFERVGVTRRRRAFEPHDLDGMWWVVAAAPPEVNEQVVWAAERRQLYVNAVDDPPNATAYLGGVVRRGDELREPAGGGMIEPVTLNLQSGHFTALDAPFRSLIGVIKANESVVICVTGNGFKTAEVMQGHVQRPVTIGRSLADFERVVAPKIAASQATA